MTAHVHDQSSHPHAGGDRSPGATTPAGRRSRPRWLVPGIAAAAIATALVAFGVVSLSSMLSVGLLGGMLLMHLGGHGGPGGHAGHGGQAADLTRRSPGSQPDDPASGAGPDPGATTNADGSETKDHDQRSSHACH